MRRAAATPEAPGHDGAVLLPQVLRTRVVPAARPVCGRASVSVPGRHGIPGSASTAVILGGFMLHGLVPGGGLFRDNGPLVYGLIVGNLLQMIFLGFFAAFIAFYVGKIVKVKSYLLVPLLIILMSIGSFAYRNLIFDVYILFIFGIIGRSKTY